MTPDFNAPVISNFKELVKTAKNKVIKSNDVFFVFSGENSSGKSFFLNILRREISKFEFFSISNLRTPGAKDNFNFKVREKDKLNFLENVNQSTNYYQNMLTNNGLKTDLSQTAMSHSINSLLEPNVFKDFKRLIKTYFIDKNFFGRNNVEVKICDDKVSAYTIPEVQEGKAKVLLIDEEHFHWGGVGFDQIIFLLPQLCNYKYEDKLNILPQVALFFDEPETGLSVKNQKIFADFIRAVPIEFPFVKKIFIATHSHVFLPNFSNQWNLYLTTKQKDEKTNSIIIRVEKVETNESDLRQFRFNKLGLNFSDLLAEKMIQVEGKTDKKFIEKIISLSDCLHNILIFTDEDKEGVGGVVKEINKRREQNFPFYGLIDLLDEKSSVDVTLKNSLISRGYLFELDQPGIEYFYPKELVRKYIKKQLTQRDINSLGITKKHPINDFLEIYLKERKNQKNKFCEFICERLGKSHLEESNIKKIIAAIKSFKN